MRYIDTVSVICMCFFFFKQKTAYEMRISDWSSDVCSSDLLARNPAVPCFVAQPDRHPFVVEIPLGGELEGVEGHHLRECLARGRGARRRHGGQVHEIGRAHV